jgi:hypothetical protein
MFSFHAIVEAASAQRKQKSSPGFDLCDIKLKLLINHLFLEDVANWKEISGTSGIELAASLGILVCRPL